jgi:SAM-dependent methyltransferase
MKAHAAPQVHETVIRLLLELRLKEKGFVRILDAGAGEGALSAKLKKLGFEVKACDRNPRLFKVKGIECDFCDLNIGLPYPNESFNCVICIETIEHLANPLNCIKEFARVLKKKGILIITTPNILNWYSRFCFFFRGLFPGFTLHDYQQSGHILPLPSWVLKILLKENGFQIRKMLYNRMILPFFYINRNTTKELFGEILICVAEKI